MKWILLLVLSNSSILAPSHDVPIAMFRISESNAALQLDITFDLEDLSSSLNADASEVDLEKIQTYLKQHTKFQFDTHIAELRLSSIQIVKDHVRVSGSLGIAKDNIKELKVENTCLNNVSNHSNIIQLDINNQSKDFRMHKGRTIINVQYF